MKHSHGGKVHGSREELKNDLLEGREGWGTTFGRPDLAEQCSDAADQLDQGADSVTVGHLRYVVTD